MPDEKPVIEHDGTAETAALMIPDEAIGLEPVKPAQNRAADGKYAKADDGQKPAAPVAQEKAAEPPAEEGDWFEVDEPGADGKPAPKRYKADEVWQGFQRAKELEGELAKARSQPGLSADHETIIADTLRQRGQYIQALEQWQQFNQPKQPDAERLLNPQSRDYDPDAYYRQMQQYRQMVDDQQKVAADLQRQKTAQDEQRQLLEHAHRGRERDALLKVWPEIAKREVAEKFVTDLQKHFGVDADTLKNVYDHRFYAIAKAAIAHIEGQAKAQQAVKVVAAKPKLVRGGTRTNISANQAKLGEASSRLAQSGSLDDAADALGALLN